uniref:Transcription factor bHLH50 n=1 Tax=Nothapodytes nimmoniana TaxID=159386 RepID=A0A9E8Z846_NOTNI|nr:transcription factor bHLH50 [Nothapodytes nimmoniana]
MENWFSSGWPEEESSSWTPNQSSCIFPWLSHRQGNSTPYIFHDDSSATFSQWPMSFEGIAEDQGGTNSSRSHSQAEKRRRDRINSHLANLRKLIPKSDKMDKAALLGSVIQHVKDLKREAMEIGKVSTIPTDIDEVIIDHRHFDEATTSSNINRSESNEDIFIKASICCDDRPDLFAELNQSLRGLKLTTVHADITSLGGRVKCIFVLRAMDYGKEGVGMDNLKQSLKLLLSRVVASNSPPSYHIKSKRQRFFLPSQFS